MNICYIPSSLGKKEHNFGAPCTNGMIVVLFSTTQQTNFALLQSFASDSPGGAAVVPARGDLLAPSPASRGHLPEGGPRHGQPVRLGRLRRLPPFHAAPLGRGCLRRPALLRRRVHLGRLRRGHPQPHLRRALLLRADGLPHRGRRLRRHQRGLPSLCTALYS